MLDPSMLHLRATGFAPLTRQASKPLICFREVVPRGGIEPPTLRFSVACSTAVLAARTAGERVAADCPAVVAGARSEWVTGFCYPDCYPGPGSGRESASKCLKKLVP